MPLENPYPEARDFQMDMMADYDTKASVGRGPDREPVT
jgi:hypothetical protein